MGYKALLKREDVYSIFRSTVEKFYKDNNYDNVYVDYKKQKETKCLVMIPFFGMIMPNWPCKKIRKHYYDAFNIRGNIIKNVLGKVCIFFLTHGFGRLFCDKRVYISKQLINNETIFCICNRSVRIFDLKNDISYSIQKDSFTDYFFKNQLNFRIMNHYDFIPPVLNNGTFWFSEPLLEGHTLARTTDDNVFSGSKTEVFKSLDALYSKTQTIVDLENYLKQLICQLNYHLDFAKKNKPISCCKEASTIIEGLSDYIKKNNDLYLTGVVSHGDLQAGNIWVSADKTYIIDWETQEIRSSWFDYFTLEYATRYFGGIKNLILNRDDVVIPNEFLLRTNLNVSQMICLFILEDVLFYLKDMNELPGNAGHITFDNYINELANSNIEELVKK